MKEDHKLDETFRSLVEISIRFGFLLVLIFWCLRIIYPFTSIILWGIILALALSPLFELLKNKLGGSSKLALSIIILAGLAIIMVPSWLFLDSMIAGAKQFGQSLNNGTLTIPKPDPKVAQWPIIGKEIHEAWLQASVNLRDLIAKYSDQIGKAAQVLADGILSAGGSILQFIISLVIAGILLISKGAEEFGKKFFKRIVGEKGDEFSSIAATTVRNVTKGVLGVALIQAFLIGMGFLLAGVPYAGIWALLVLVLAILQLPATLVVLPIVIWMFSAFNMLPAILWTVYLILAGMSDNVLKPILLGKGAAVPMMVIFLGVIGGFMMSGFIGLFTGAIVISLGYKLFVSWLNEPKTSSITQQKDAV